MFETPAMYCVLCSFMDDAVGVAHLVVDGYSMCSGHARAVIERSPDIWFDPNDHFHLRATIQNASRDA